MKRYIIIVLLLLVIGVATYTSYLSYTGKYRVLSRQPQNKYENFSVTSLSRDQLTINGWYLPGSQCQTIVIVPGWSENRTILLDWAEYWQEQGYAVVVYDPRGGTGKNTMANREQQDLEAVINWLHDNKTPNSNIVLVGHSVGGAVVQALAAKENYDGIVLVSSVYDMNQTRKMIFVDRGLWFPQVFAFGNMITDRVIYGFKTLSLAKIWDNINTPVLILHGTADEKSPLKLVRERLKSKPTTALFEVEGNHRVFLDDVTKRQLGAAKIIEWTKQLTCQSD